MFIGNSSSSHPGLPTAQEEVVNSILTLISIPLSPLPSAQPLLHPFPPLFSNPERYLKGSIVLV